MLRKIKKKLDDEDDHNAIYFLCVSFASKREAKDKMKKTVLVYEK
jgi:hypothetical protein